MRASSAGAWINDRASNSRMPLTVRVGEKQCHFSRCWLEPIEPEQEPIGMDAVGTLHQLLHLGLRESALSASRPCSGGRRAWPSAASLFVDRDATELAQEPVPGWSPTDQWHARHSQLFTVLVPIDDAGGSAYSLIACCWEQTRLSGCERHRRRPVLTCAHLPYRAGHGPTKISQNGAILNRR